MDLSKLISSFLSEGDRDEAWILIRQIVLFPTSEIVAEFDRHYKGEKERKPNAYLTWYFFGLFRSLPLADKLDLVEQAILTEDGARGVFQHELLRPRSRLQYELDLKYLVELKEGHPLEKIQELLGYGWSYCLRLFPDNQKIREETLLEIVRFMRREYILVNQRKAEEDAK